MNTTTPTTAELAAQTRRVLQAVLGEVLPFPSGLAADAAHYAQAARELAETLSELEPTRRNVLALLDDPDPPDGPSDEQRTAFRFEHERAETSGALRALLLRSIAGTLITVHTATDTEVIQGAMAVVELLTKNRRLWAPDPPAWKDFYATVCWFGQETVDGRIVERSLTMHPLPLPIFSPTGEQCGLIDHVTRGDALMVSGAINSVYFGLGLAMDLGVVESVRYDDVDDVAIITGCLRACTVTDNPAHPDAIIREAP